MRGLSCGVVIVVGVRVLLLLLLQCALAYTTYGRGALRATPLAGAETEAEAAGLGVGGARPSSAVQAAWQVVVVVTCEHLLVHTQTIAFVCNTFRAT